MPDPHGAICAALLGGAVYLYSPPVLARVQAAAGVALAVQVTAEAVGALAAGTVDVVAITTVQYILAEQAEP